MLDEDGNQIELKEDEDALDTFNLARMDADDERQNRYACLLYTSRSSLPAS